MTEVIKDGLQLARGYIDFVKYLDGQLTIRGWMLLPDENFDKISVFINQKFVCETEILESDDVKKAFPFIPQANFSRFDVSIEINGEKMKGLISICMIGMTNGQQVAKIETFFSKEIDLPNYPVHLMQRVANTESHNCFWASAFQTFHDYWELVCKYGKPKKIRTMLDWGCGCGRLINVFENITEIPRIYGCDIDAEAIGWCKKNIDHARFAIIPPLPPIEYPDNFFDLIIGQSIFTHLPRDVQVSWLEEMKRIVSPGGLFLASVHGEFATYFTYPDLVKDILKDGIHDENKDSFLDGIAPDNYYRATYQTQEYTRKIFGEHFKILDYVERGSVNFQDIVVMRKKSAWNQAFRRTMHAIKIRT